MKTYSDEEIIKIITLYLEDKKKAEYHEAQFKYYKNKQRKKMFIINKHIEGYKIKYIGKYLIKSTLKEFKIFDKDKFINKYSKDEYIDLLKTSIYKNTTIKEIKR